MFRKKKTNLPETIDPSINLGFPETLEVIFGYTPIYRSGRAYGFIAYEKAPISFDKDTEVAIYQKVAVKKFRREIVEVTDTKPDDGQ